MRHLLIGLGTLLWVSPIQAQLAEPNDAGVTFGHLHLAVTDVDLHTKLWTELFDGVLAQREGYAAVQVPGALVFFTESEPTAPSMGTSMDHFGFMVRDIEAVLGEWHALGYEVDTEFRSAGGVPSAYITMPDGARLELQEDPELPVKARMNHVHFFTPRDRELLAWYADVFGAIPRVHINAGLTADLPGASLNFGNSEVERAASEGTAIDHIGFEVEDLEAFARVLRARGVEFEYGPLYIESIEVWVAFFTDLSGVLVEVTEGLDRWARDAGLEAASVQGRGGRSH